MLQVFNAFTELVFLFRNGKSSVQLDCSVPRTKGSNASRMLPLQLLLLQQLLPNSTPAFQNSPWSRSLFLWLVRCTHQSPKSKTYLHFRGLCIRVTVTHSIIFPIKGRWKKCLRKYLMGQLLSPLYTDVSFTSTHLKKDYT